MDKALHRKPGLPEKSLRPRARRWRGWLFFWCLPLFAGLAPAAQAAELSVSVATSPSQGTLDEPLTYTVTLLAVPSGESSVIAGTTLNYGLPPAFKLDTVKSSQGSCTSAAIVTCQIGELTAQPVTVTLGVIPQETGTISSNIIVTGTRLDPKTGDLEPVTSSTSLSTAVLKPLPVQIDFSPTEYTVNESAGTITLTVTRGGESERAVSVDFASSDGTATAGQDYTATSGTLAWEEGDVQPKTISVPVLEDRAVEKAETFSLTLSNPVGASLGASSAVVTIQDNETPGRIEFSSATYQVFEAEAQAVITVVRNDGGDGPATVAFGTRDGSAKAGQDYTPAGGALTWGDRDTAAKTFVVPIRKDELIEGEETVYLELSADNQDLLGLSSAVLTIVDDISAENAAKALTDVAQNPVQREIGQVLGTLCQSGQADAELQQRCRELIVQAGREPEQVAHALQQIAPEEYAAQGRMAVELPARQVRNIYTRLMALRSGASGGIKLDDLKISVEGTPIPKLGLEGAPSPESLGAPVPGQLPPGKLPAGVAHKYGLYDLGGFLNGSISVGSRDASEREAGYDFDSVDLAAGADYRVNDNLVLGAALGYASGNADFAADGGGMDIQAYNVSLYGTYYEPQSFYVDAVYSFGNSDYDLNRNLVYAVGGTQVNQVAQAAPGGEQSLFSLSGGYHYQYGESLTLTPTARLDYIKATVDGFSEKLSAPQAAGAELGLEIDGQSIRSTNFALGGQALYAIKTDWGTLLPEARLEWVKELDNESREIRGRFLHDAGGRTFVLYTDDPDTQYLNLGLGLSLQYDGGQSAFISYETLIGMERVSTYSLMAGIRLEF